MLIYQIQNINFHLNHLLKTLCYLQTYFYKLLLQFEFLVHFSNLNLMLEVLLKLLKNYFLRHLILIRLAHDFPLQKNLLFLNIQYLFWNKKNIKNFLFYNLQNLLCKILNYLLQILLQVLVQTFYILNRLNF